MKLNEEMIKSNSNAKIADVRKLKDKKHRKECGLFICEGVNIVCDIPQNISIISVFLTQKMEKDEKVSTWLKQRGLHYTLVSDDVMTCMSDTITPSGVLCVVPFVEEKSIEGDRVLVLDGIKDPGNLGTIIRTAAACGYRDIITSDCVDVYNSKVIRSTMSGIFKVNIVTTDATKMQNILHGYEVFALDMDGENIFNYLSKNKKPRKFAIIVGSEAQGISAEMKKAATKILSLPMEKDVESLNAAVTVGIACYLLKNM